MSNIKNLAVGTIATAPSPATTGTTLTLTSGQGTRYPAAPFYITAFPPAALPSTSNSEILLVTAVSTDTFTITRAQKGTTAQSIAAGWIVSNSIYTEDLFTSSINIPETLAGTPNGVLTTFTTSQPYTMLWLFKNGVYMYPGSGNDYTYSGSTVTFTTAPATGARLTAVGIAGSQVMISGSNNLPTDETPSGSVNGSNTSFTTSRPYVSGTLEVFINGTKQKRTTHFTETTPTSGVFTMSDAPLTGDDIMVNYQYTASTTGNAQTVNGISASTTATANQLVALDSSGLAPSGSVSFSSFGSNKFVVSGNQTSLASTGEFTYTSTQTIDITALPVGAQVLVGATAFGNGGGTNSVVRVAIVYNGSTTSESNGFAGYYVAASPSGIVTKVTGQNTITINRATTTTTNFNYYAIRVG